MTDYIAACLCQKHGYFAAHLGRCPVCDEACPILTETNPKKPKQSTEIKQSSELEEKLLGYMVMFGVELPEREYAFHPTKKYRFDFAWPEKKLAVEIDGGEWLERGGHSWGEGFKRDREKQNEAVLLGWRLLRFTGSHIDNEPSYCIDTIKQALAATDA